MITAFFERLNKIYEKSDLYVILPGGIGTLSEFFGLWEEIRDTNKKIILFNYDSYYTNLVKFIKEKKAENFIKKEDYENIKVVMNFEEFKKEVMTYGKQNIYGKISYLL